jgi:hypothetical protein
LRSFVSIFLYTPGGRAQAVEPPVINNFFIYWWSRYTPTAYSTTVSINKPNGDEHLCPSPFIMVIPAL